jgi:hypothetical protein
MRTRSRIGEREYLAFAASCARDWSEAETRRVSAAVRAILPVLATVAQLLPPRVWLVKTTGDEEGGGGYTRGHAVVPPVQRLTHSVQGLGAFVAHELFHIITRTRPGLRDDLYVTLGFERLAAEVEIPDAPAGLMVSNPDAVALEHAIELELGGERRTVVPVLVWDGSDGQEHEGAFFGHVDSRLLVLDNSASWSGRQQGTCERHVWRRIRCSFATRTAPASGCAFSPKRLLAERLARVVCGPVERAADPIGPMRAVVEGPILRPLQLGGAAPRPHRPRP